MSSLHALLLAGVLAGEPGAELLAPGLSHDATTVAQAAPELIRLRHLYLAAVHEERYIEEAFQEIERVRESRGVERQSPINGTLAAYQGALLTLRAKHALWPPTRLRFLREGLRVLDAQVAAYPSLAEIRYLRLMSCYYLPSILGRRETVREDFSALARLLPGQATAYPDDLYRAIVRFVLEKGDLSPEQRAPLEAVLRHSDG